jgi:hypothetical protein
MPKNAQQRLAKWTERYAGKSIPACVTEQMKTSLVETMTKVFEEQVAVEEAVKLILAEAGFATMFNGFYHAFGKQVWTAMQKFSGTQLLAEVDAMVSNWHAKGLDTDTLERIRNSVFALAAPAP